MHCAHTQEGDEKFPSSLISKNLTNVNLFAIPLSDLRNFEFLNIIFVITHTQGDPKVALP